MNIQHSPSFRTELDALHAQAATLVDAALEALDADPTRADAIFQTTVDQIREEIFCDGCLGPGTGAANPDPHLERLGAACGKFDERALDRTDLSIDRILVTAQRAAQFLDLADYTIGKQIDDPPHWKSLTLKTRTPTADQRAAVDEFGLTLENLKYLSLIEPTYDLFRCSYEYQWSTGQLIVRGRAEFVTTVLGTQTPNVP